MSKHSSPTSAPHARTAHKTACIAPPRVRTKALFLRAAERGVHLGVLTRGLLALLDSHGAAALEAAIAAALAEDAAHLGAVRHFVDRHAHARAQPPPIAVALPDDPRLHALHVRSHSLAGYAQLTAQSTDACDSTDPEPKR